jgi:heme-degrading monooxygenase HmoA
MNMSTTQASTIVDFASGNWTVSAGKNDEFLARWEEFLQWTKAEAKGFVEATLLHDLDNTQHYVSLGRWETSGDRDAWKAMPAFGEHLMACRSLCDDFSSSDYERSVEVV